MSKNKTAVPKKKKKMLKGSIVFIIVAALITGVVIFIPGLLGAESDSGPVMEKRTAFVAAGDISKSLSASAPIVSSEKLVYKPDSSSEVLDILIQDKSFVSAGDTIMVLDTSSTDSRLDSLLKDFENKMDLAEDKLDSIGDKHEAIDNLREDIKDKQDDIIGLNDDIADIEDQIDDNELFRNQLNVTAPIDGTIFGIGVGIGDYVSTNTVFATLTDVSSYEIEMTFSADILDGDITGVMVSYLNNDFEGEIVSFAGYTYKSQFGSNLVDVVIAFRANMLFDGKTSFSGKISTDSKEYRSVSEGSPYKADTVKITAGISGEITELYMSEKQSVSKGDVLAVLEGGTIDDKTESLYNQIESIRGQIDGYNDQIESYRSGMDSHYKDIADLEEDIKDLEEDMAEIEDEMESVKGEYDNSYIRAAFDGVITDMNVTIGDSVTTNTTLFTLVKIQNPGMVLAIDELDIAEVSEGLEVSIIIDALPGTETKPVIGYVENIALEGKSQGGVTTYDVTIGLSGIPEGFRLGMNATATIFTSKSVNTLYLPIEAVTIQNGRTFVYLVDETAEGEPAADFQPVANTDSEVALGDGLTGTVTGGGRGTKDPSTMTEEELAAFESRLAEKGMTLDDYMAQQETEAVSGEENEQEPSEIYEYYTGTRLVEVTTGIYNALYIEILGGLEIGDEVLLPPVYKSAAAVIVPEEGGIIGIPGIPGTGTGGGGGGGGKSSGSLAGGGE